MFRKVIAPALFMIIFPELLHAGGREITIVTTSGDSIVGELLSVRPGELLLTRGTGVDDAILEREPALIIRLPFSNVAVVRAEGRNYTIIGALLGAGVGVIIASAITKQTTAQAADSISPFSGLGQDIRNSFNAAGEASITIAGGCLLGWVVGKSLSADDIAIPGSQVNDLRALKSEARYSLEEPAFLKRLK